MLDSVVMISVPGGACATAFLDVHGRIFTNSHVTRSLCSFGSCGSVRVQRARGIGRFPDEDVVLSELALVSDIPSIDVAVLEQKGDEPLRGIFGSPIAAKKGDSITVLGFPHCHTLELSRGQIIENDPLRVYTDARIAHGSSGSPMFDAQMRLVGMVDEATTILGGLDSLLFGGTFEGRGVSAEAMSSLLVLEPRASLLAEAKLLGELADRHVKVASGSRRLREGLELADRVEGFLQRVALLQSHEPGLTNGFVIMRDLSLFPRTKPTENDLGREIEALALTASLEENGFIGQALTALEPDGLIESLKTSGREPEHVARLEEIVMSFESGDHIGSVWMIAMLAAGAAVLVALLVAAWGWSLGYVFAASSGGFLWRVGCMILVGVALWPISFLFYLFTGSRKRP